MPPSELPPKPPEYEHEPTTRAILIAMLGIYARQIGRAIKERDSRVLAHAPIQHIQGVLPPQRQSSNDESLSAGEDHFYYHRLSKMAERYTAIRQALDTDLEKASTSALNEQWVFNMITKGLKKGLERDFSVADIMALYNTLLDNARTQGVAEMFKGIKQPLTDAGFVTRFGYDSTVVGLRNEALALLSPSGSSKQHVLIGMTVSYIKHMKSSGRTGPLAGTGRITAFIIPSRENAVIADQMIQLEVTTDEGVFIPLISPDEISYG